MLHTGGRGLKTAGIAVRLASLLLAVLLLPAPALAAQLCSEPTSMTVLAMDTARGKVLLSLVQFSDPESASHPSLVEFDTNTKSARLFPGPALGELFAGSIGPGPLLALRRCGEGCVQAQEWSEGKWRAFGNPLEVVTEANLHLTYDRSGTAWLTVHQLTQERGLSDISAFRLVDDDWRSAGRLIVHASGTPAVTPAPWQRDGIVVGSGLFSAEKPPSFWVHGLPPIEQANRGSLIALTETNAAFIAENGALLYSDNLGASWVMDKWRPWGIEQTPLWRYGSDYSIDLPLGSLAGPLPVVWFDQRPLREAELHLAELSTGGRWKRLAESVPRVEGATGEALEMVTFLHTDAGRWLLFSDCHRQDERPGFLLRSCPPSGLSAALFIPILKSKKDGG